MEHPIKYHTAPSRLRKRDSNVWDDLHAMIDAVDAEQGRRQHPQNHSHHAATLSGAPPMVARHSDGGSWSRQFKRRTSEEGTSMSLWEVSEALNVAASQPPATAERATSGDEFGLSDLDALQALVDAEETELSEKTTRAPAPADDLASQRFVDAVFGDGLPELTLARTETTDTTEEEQLQDDLLLAMLRTDGQPWDLSKPFVAEGPESPSPTSVETLFGEALSGDVSPTDQHGAHQFSPAAHNQFSPTAHANVVYHAPFAQHLEVCAAESPALPAVLTAVPLPPTAQLSGSSRNGAERKEWTAAEDEIIHSSVVIHGCKWRKIAALLPGRSDDAVRNRWNRLKEGTTPGAPPSAHASGGDPPVPAAKRNPSTSSEGGNKPERVSWTKAEDYTILSSVAELGHKWNKLAERLPGRTDHAIRNRFHRLQTMLEDKQRGQQRFFAPAQLLPPTMPLAPFALS